MRGRPFGLTRLSLLLAALLAAAVIWRALARIHRPIDALIRSADRVGQGDYTRPFEVERGSALCIAVCSWK